MDERLTKWLDTQVRLFKKCCECKNFDFEGKTFTNVGVYEGGIHLADIDDIIPYMIEGGYEVSSEIFDMKDSIFKYEKSFIYKKVKFYGLSTEED